MKRAIAKLGARAIPGNSKMGYTLRAWRKELIADLGGEENVSLQQRTIVEVASTTKLMISSLVSMLAQLGLERRPPPVKTLEEYLAEDHRGDEAEMAEQRGNGEEPK